MMDQTNYVNRPGCVTAYAVLLVLGGILYILIALAQLVIGLTSEPLIDPAYTFCIGLFSIVPLATAVGLWRMRRWAWWVVVITQSLGGLGGLVNLCLAVTSTNSVETASYGIGGGVGLLVSGLIVYWFITNRALFNGGAAGQPAYAPVSRDGASSGTAIAVIAVVAVGLFCILPVVVIAILALLGPQIGNVFSQINSGLSTPMP